MATDKKIAPNIDNSDPTRYPNGRIKDNTGAGDGTPVNRLIYGDLHEFFAKLMRLAGIAYNGLPDNETNGYQLVAAVAALAGKNDIIYDLNLVSGMVDIGLDITILQNKERLLCKAAFDIDSTTVTQIKGTKVNIYTISVPSDFKANDYVLFIKTSTAVILQRIADGNNVNAIAAEYAYLKAATEAEEYAGSSTSKASTPYTNQLAFARRVIGLDSGMFLATALRNGLMSKEDKAILDGLVNPVKNFGWFSGVNVMGNTPGAPLPVGGGLTAASCVANDGSTLSSEYVITFANPMANINYCIDISVESQSLSLAYSNLNCPIFLNKTTTGCNIILSERSGLDQNLKVYIKAVQI